MATYHQLGALDQHKPNSTPRHILVSTRSKHDTRYMEKRRCHNKKIPGLPGSSRVKTRPALEKWVDPVPGLQVKRIAWSWTWRSNPGRHRMAQKRDFGTITYCIRPENNVSNSSELSWFDMYLICIYMILYIYYYMYNTKRIRTYTTISYWDDFMMIPPLYSTRSNKKIAWRQLVGRQGQQDFTGSIGRYLRAVGSTGKTTESLDR